VRQSRRLNGRIFLLGLRNPSFMVIPAILYVLLFFAAVSRLASQDNRVDLAVDPRPWGFVDILLSQVGLAPLVLILGVAAMLSAFCIVPKRVPKWRSRPYRGVAGLVQTGCHVAAQAAITMSCVHYFPLTGWRVWLCMVLVGLVGAVVGSLVFAAFLFLWFILFSWNSTEAFSSFRYTGYKNFLRIHVTQTKLTVYPIGIDKICEQWDYDPEPESPDASWLKPRGGTIETRLIEKEFTIVAPVSKAKKNEVPATSEFQAEQSDYAPRG
jgi:hypothetical protein